MSVDLQQLLRTAIEYHQAGQLQQAEILYRQVLQNQAQQPEALHGLGLIALQIDKPELSIELIKKAIHLKPTVAAFHLHLGNALQAIEKFSEAEMSYQNAIRLRPQDYKAYNNLASCLNQQGLFAKAAHYYQQALDIQPHHPEIKQNLIDALLLWAKELFDQQQFSAVIPHLNTILTLQPNNAHAFLGLGDVYRNLSQLDLAIEYYQRALQAKPDYVEAYQQLGLTFQTQKRFTAALEQYHNALSLKPDNFQVYNNLAVALQELEEFTQAVECYKRAIELNPNYFQLYYNLAIVLQRQKKLPEAIDYYQQALQHSPVEDRFKIHHNLAVTLQEQKQFEEAIVHYQQALHANPSGIEAIYGLGTALQEQNKLSEATSYYQKVLHLDSHYAQAHYALGTIAAKNRQVETAIIHYEQAINDDPDFVKAHVNLALESLKIGNLSKGWREYEWRLKMEERSAYFLIRKLGTDQWDGSPLAGRHLLIHWEQGFGDNIQFARYLPLITGGKVTFICQESIACLLRESLYHEVNIVVQSSEHSNSDESSKIDYDVWIALLSLPHVFNTTLETIPSVFPYLVANPAKVARWRSRFSKESFNIGIVWAGNPQHDNDHNRSCALTDFLPLTEIPHTTFFSLQKGEGAKQPLPKDCGIISLTEELTDFTQTAAAITCLDLVISVDTSVVHLAGALGKPVWVLLPFVPDWRWLLQGQHSAWYPTARLFRQTELGNWNSVFEQVHSAVRFGTAD